MRYLLIYGLLELALVCTKLQGALSCGWWLVLMPFWLPLACALLAAIAVFCIMPWGKGDSDKS